MENRRDFIKKAGIATAALTLGTKFVGSSAMGFSAKSYNRIIGANDAIRVGVIGVNGRGNGMAGVFAAQKNTSVSYICDVDSRVISKAIKTVMDAKQDTAPISEADFRKVLADKNTDAIYIATPDHWHSPMTIMGCQAGKHVYVEKPLSHNPNEGELAIAAARKYKRVVQMGAQRRSAPVLTQGIKQLHDGIIGRVYLAKTWYTNARKPNVLKAAEVPSWLNYELWQGPAPRMPYKDGLIHSMGGRYNYKDDWETPDTQLTTLEYPGGINLVWEGRSANGRKVEELDRGIIFYGEKGSLDTGGDSYKIYDLNGKLIKEVKSLMKEDAIDGRNTSSPSLGLDNYHVIDFLDAIRNNRKPNCDVEIGHKSVVAMQLGNIALRVGRDLKIDSKNGHIVNDKDAEKLWSRSYEKGWEPKV
ncbi:MAG: twin-arginine translocation signal domain-containing protein [Pedobacter sp.]|nr:MAG: twin-arginine translocation signal domain-containing protein [Pedobacter sp.]